MSNTKPVALSVSELIEKLEAIEDKYSPVVFDTSVDHVWFGRLGEVAEVRVENGICKL